MANEKRMTDEPDANRDPLSGAAGAHPVGTGTGATAGGLAGAAMGAVAGPIGALAGLVIGAVAGGYAGKGAAEAINPTAEDAYWRENYRTRPYVTQGSDYERYRPAYEYGWNSWSRYSGRTFDEAEPELRNDWTTNYGSSGLDWDTARGAVRDAWSRVDQNIDTTEDEYWRQNYSSRSYANPSTSYDQYAPAYQLGRRARARYEDRDFDSVDNDLQQEWERYRTTSGQSGLGWDQARHAARDAWDRSEHRITVPSTGAKGTGLAGGSTAGTHGSANTTNRTSGSQNT